MEQALQRVNEAKRLMDENQGENWTQEVQDQIDGLLDEADALKARGEQGRRVETGLSYFEDPVAPPPPVTGDVPPGEAGKGETGDPEIDTVAVNAEYSRAFKSYLVGGMRGLNTHQMDVIQRGYVELDGDQKTLSANVGTEGGFLVPADFRAVMVEEVGARSFLRNLVDVMPCSGQFLEMPVVEAPSSNAGIYANGIAWTWTNSPMDEDTGDTEPEFGLLRIPMHDAVAKTRLGLNMINDAAVNIEAALPRWYGEAWGLQEDYVILRGTGRGQPLGILEDTDITGSHYVETSTSGVVKADDLIDLVYDLEAQYAANARWVTSRTNLKSVRKLKDGEGNYLWQPGLSMGEPDTLIGYPVSQSPWMPAISANNYAFIFGDLKRYGLGERQRVTMTVLREKYIEELKIGYMAHVRIGGQAKIARAFRVLKIKS
jgi:HK97 family phage major capsid protein